MYIGGDGITACLHIGISLSGFVFKKNMERCNLVIFLVI